MEEWQEKLHCSAGPLALGYQEEVGKISETRQWSVAHRHLNAPPPEQLRLSHSLRQTPGPLECLQLFGLRVDVGSKWLMA